MADEQQVLTGYRFFAVKYPEALQQTLQTLASEAGVLGTVLVAAEGINLSVAGSADALARFSAGLARELGNECMPALQMSPSRVARPFRRLRVRLRDEIVALGRPDDPHEFAGASELDSARWDAVLADPAIPVIDVRNQYETSVGQFAGAVDPGTRSFREFPDWVATHLDPETTPEVAMYCTGGIRCTKAAAWMRGQGFRKVHELGGGILQYLASVPEPRSQWQGECFVFDERVGLRPGLRQGALRVCEGCGQPLDTQAQRAARFEATARCLQCQADDRSATG